MPIYFLNQKSSFFIQIKKQTVSAAFWHSYFLLFILTICFSPFDFNVNQFWNSVVVFFLMSRQHLAATTSPTLSRTLLVFTSSSYHAFFISSTSSVFFCHCNVRANRCAVSTTENTSFESKPAATRKIYSIFHLTYFRWCNISFWPSLWKFSFFFFPRFFFLLHLNLSCFSTIEARCYVMCNVLWKPAGLLTMHMS